VALRLTPIRYLADVRHWVEITPLRSVDGRPAGDSKLVPVIKKIQDLFFGLFEGRTADKHGRLDYL